MFSCDHCKYLIASSKIMDIHNRTFHSKDQRYSCNICGYQVSNKINLVRHKKIVHEGVKYPCRQCDHQATTIGSLAQHKRAVHGGVKYPYRQATYGESISLVDNVTIKQNQSEILLDM